MQISLFTFIEMCKFRTEKHSLRAQAKSLNYGGPLQQTAKETETETEH